MRYIKNALVILPAGLLLVACGSSASTSTSTTASPTPTKLTTQDGAQFRICQLIPEMHTAIQGGDAAAIKTLNAKAWTIWTDGPWLGLPSEADFKQSFFKYHAAWETGSSDLAMQAWDEWTGSCTLYGYAPSPSS